jgi:serine/threonine protein kinase
MLTKDPLLRITAHEAINHDWIHQKEVKDTNLAHAKESLSNLKSFHVFT